MDDFIHDKARGLDRFIKLGVSNLWVVSYEGEVVAMFALGKDALVLNNEDRIYMQSKSFVKRMRTNFGLKKNTLQSKLIIWQFAERRDASI